MFRFLISSFLLALLVGSIALVLPSSQSTSLRVSRRLDEDAQPAVFNLDAEAQALKSLHVSLCSAETNPRYPPLPYDRCPEGGVLNVIPLMGGMTNALKMVLLGAIMSFEEGRCFYVDESRAHLNPMKDGKQQGFIQKYFEPIGLARNHPYVEKAFAEKRVQVRRWTEYWNDMDLRRVYGKNYTIPSLGYENIEGHQLKKVFLRRMWRPLPEFRESTCQSLAQHDLGDEFLSFSVRRGDKSLENFAFTPLPQYIGHAESVLHRFGGTIPKVFVASDDCTVMKEFREMRPTWTFVSECDKEEQQDAGFALQDVKRWGEEKEVAHFRKFFVEMHSFVLLDKAEGRVDYNILDNW